jgi:Tol biopolymer transport system component
MLAASLTPQGQVGDGESRSPAISSDGQFVAFESLAFDLAANDNNGTSDIFLYSLQDGSLRRVSVNAENEEGDGPSYNPDLSADGSFVAFQSAAENLWEHDSNSKSDIFIYYRDGNNQIHVDRASVAEAGGQANDNSGYPSISADGRFVTYSSFASNLAGGEIYGSNLDIYLYDRQESVTERISADPIGQEPDGASVNPDISADGRVISFDSTATNLVSDDTNSRVDVFVRDRMPPVELTINYPVGTPGSFFTVSGSRFLAESNVSLVVNGTNLGNVTSDSNGEFVIILATDAADPGVYILHAAAGTLEGGVVFILDQNSTERPQEAQGAIFNIPPGIAYTHFSSIPVMVGN